MDSRKREKKPGYLVKLDFVKAFDRESWNFLDYMLMRCGFGIRWRACISTTHFSIIINGSPQGHISCSRELSQGDLLSPLLFVLIT